jgi:hypothetical protein
VYFLPGFVMLVVATVRADLKAAAVVAGAMGGLLALGWWINLMVESRGNEKGPAS